MKTKIILWLLMLACGVQVGRGQQANVSYEVRTTSIYSNNNGYGGISQCSDDGAIERDEEYRALVSFSDNANPSPSYSITNPCMQGNCNDACSYGNNVLVGSVPSVNASYIALTFEGWEENDGLIGGGNCVFNSSGAGQDNGGCHFWDYRTEYFRNTSPSSTNYTTRGQYTTDAHTWGYKFKWKYTGNANLITPICTSNPITTYSAGIIPSWSVSLTAGMQYSFQAGGRELRLYGTTGFTLMTSGTGSISYTCPTTGIYYLEISGANRSVTPATGYIYYTCVGVNCNPQLYAATPPCTIATTISNNNATTASVTLSICGGIPNYTYYMDGNQIQITSSSSFTYTIPLSSNPNNSTHSFYVKDNINRTTSTAIITLPILGYTTMSGPTISDKTLCSSGQTITINTSVANGSGTYSYRLYRNNTSPNPPTLLASNLNTTLTNTVFTLSGANSQVGSYSVEIFDGYCTLYRNFVINPPPSFTINTPMPYKAGCQGSASANVKIGYTATADIQVTGGTGLDSCSLTGLPNSYQVIPANSTLTLSFPVGSSTLYVKDFNGCVKTTTVNVEYPYIEISAVNSGYIKQSSPNSLQSGDLTNISNSSSSSSNRRGWVTFNLANAVLPAGATLVSADLRFVVSDISMGSTAPMSIYAFTVIGSVNYSICSTGTMIYNTMISDVQNPNIIPLQNNLTVIQSNIGGNINFGFVEPTPPSWSNPQFDIRGYNASSNSSKPKLRLYYIPSNLTLTLSAPPILCNGGQTTITGTITGGVAPYQYKLGNGAWVNISGSSFTPPPVSAGNYTFSVRDAVTNCTTSTTITITQPNLLVATAIKTNVLCYGGNTGTTTANVTGGTSPYTYTWNTNPIQYTATASNLMVGTYTVSAKDVNNCMTTASVTITQPAAALVANIASQTNVLCYGNATGSGTVSATGGTPAYSYTWNTNPVQYGATATNLIAGTYTVTANDVNNCSKNTNVTITEPSSPLQINLISQTNLSCVGILTGSASVNASGGTPSNNPPPYFYSWNNGQTSSTATNLNAGLHTVWVHDANNCEDTLTVSITSPSPLLLNAKLLNCTDSISQAQYQTIVGNISGGVFPYQYSYTCNSASQSGNTNCGWVQNNITAPANCGNINITDANGCTLSDSLNTTNTLCAFVIDSSTCRPIMLANGEVHIRVPVIANETFSCVNGITLCVYLPNGSPYKIHDFYLAMTPNILPNNIQTTPQGNHCITLSSQNMDFSITQAGQEIGVMDFKLDTSTFTVSTVNYYPFFGLIKAEVF